MKNFIKVFFIVIFAVFLLYPLMGRAQFFFMKNPLLDQMAPEFVLKNLKGEIRNFTELRNGQDAIIFFWTTWCPHCREQLSQLNADKEKIKNNNIKLILVDLGESASQVNAYFKKHNFAFDVFFDADGEVAGAYQVMG
ncbi:MAG TPA: TlpA disulfide reductase family protein, partial [Candidatus Omnitrophota bacterium]|nr:TlpA disulfide reductase family protein [Candidatus Omnitrophota bacterium]